MNDHPVSRWLVGAIAAILVLSVISTLDAAQAASTKQAALYPTSSEAVQTVKPGNVRVISGVSFAPHVDYAVGNQPNSVAVADLNHDGKLDLLTTNQNDATVSVRLGDGTGGFGPESHYSVGSGPQSVALGGFDGTGNADLVTANYGNNNVSVRLGDGAGGFGAESQYAVGSAPKSVVVGGFNGDDDIATANYGDNSVSVLLGNGGGSFGVESRYAVGNQPISLMEGDFNGDGKLDLVTANYGGGSVSLLLGSGAGGFGASASYLVGTHPYSVAVGDFNGDGKLDLVTANQPDATVTVLLGNGAGGFGTAIPYPAGPAPYSVTVGDFNGDGYPDLAVANFSGTVSVLLNDGHGNFGAAVAFPVGDRPQSVAVGDFNGDGKPDLATANAGGGNVSVLLNTTISATTPTPTDCANPFVDTSGNIFYPAIHYLYCRSVVNGTDASHFSPHGSSTRAQFAKVVVLGFGLSLYTPPSGPDFTDVPSSYYAYTFIETGFHNGILSGFDNATCTAAGATPPCYLPNRPITRGQLTKLVVNAAHYTLVTPGGQTFSDVPPSNVFYLAIETAHAKAVINGYPDSTFRPNQNIQRDQMCQIVYKGVTTP